jgi:malate/lactate dehydrogenase
MGISTFKSENKTIYKNISIIGMGRIGESLLMNILNEKERLGLNDIYIYSRPTRQKEINRVNGIIQQLPPKYRSFSIHHTHELEEIGNNTDILILTIGKKEGGGKRREDLIGMYFKDIKNIMEGMERTPPLIIMATNHVTSNCLVAHLYSKTENPYIVGFTRMDRLRAEKILRNWLESENYKNANEINIDLDILGPHGYGLLTTNIRIGGNRPFLGSPIFNNDGMGLFFEDPEKTIERLSRETAEIGEKLYESTAPEGTPSIFSSQILETLENILTGRRDIVAVDVNLSDLCRSGLRLPKRPFYMSFPVKFIRGEPNVDVDYMDKIPKEYREKLLKTLRKEEKRIKNYLLTHSNENNEMDLLRKHFNI